MQKYSCYYNNDKKKNTWKVWCLFSATLSTRNVQIVAVSLENNAALNGSDWQGVDWLIGWLRGRTVIIRARKSHAFSQIIPGLKAPIVITGCGVLLSEPPHGDNNATIQGHSLLQAGQFQVWIGCVASGLY